MIRPDRQLLLRKFRQACIHYESASEMQAVAGALFLEAKRLVDEIEDTWAETDSMGGAERPPLDHQRWLEEREAASRG